MILLVAVYLLAVICDIKENVIPNSLILAGMAMCILTGNADFKRLVTVPAVLIILIPLWKLGAFGGGDIKLVAMSSMILGPQKCLNAFVYALFWAALISLILVAIQKIDPQKGFVKREFVKSSTFHIIHFSVPLLLGFITEGFMGDIIRSGFM